MKFLTMYCHQESSVTEDTIYNITNLICFQSHKDRDLRIYHLSSLRSSTLITSIFSWPLVFLVLIFCVDCVPRWRPVAGNICRTLFRVLFHSPLLPTQSILCIFLLPFLFCSSASLKLTIIKSLLE